MKKRTMIASIALWLVVIALLAFFMKPTGNTRCTAQEGRLSVTGRSGYELSFTYEELTAVEYREELDFGSRIDGVDDSREKSGRWESGELGQYLLCVNAKVKPCIVLRTAEQTFVINYESGKSTRALYDALLEQVGAAK